MNHDPIESTEKFQEAMRKIHPQLDELNEQLDKQGYGLGSYHIFWQK